MKRTRRTRDFCADWLLQILSENGPMKVSDIVNAGKEQGYSRAMVFRVREMLQDVVVNTLGYRHPNNCWRLDFKGDLMTPESPDDPWWYK